jgi:hypothetical protein
MKVKTGTYTGTGAALGLDLGFVPDFMEIYDAYGGLCGIYDSSMADGEILLIHPDIDSTISSAAPYIGSTAANCANRAFDIRIAGIPYNVSADAAGTAPTATVVPVSTYGAFGYEVAADGTIDSGWDAANNAAGYASEALAIAGIRAVAASGSHVRAFFFTVTSSSGSYTGATTALNTSTLTVNYYEYSDLRLSSGGITIIDETEYVTSGTIVRDDGTSATASATSRLTMRGPQLGTSRYINTNGALMEGVRHFRRKACIVHNLNPVDTKDGKEFDIRFLANGMSVKIKHGQEVKLIEPAYNALIQNERIDHKLKTTVDPATGNVTHEDIKTPTKQFTVIDKSEWFWPEGHSPYDKDGNLIRPDLTKEELAKAPQNPQFLEKKEAEKKKKATKSKATK